jgi:Type II restriction endonuclease, TdeIII
VKKETKDEIESTLLKCVYNTIERVKTSAGRKPFHEALLTKEILVASQFERSFSTSFGQGAIEDISRIVATGNGCDATKQYELHLDITKGALDECERILSALRAGHASPNWANEVARVCAIGKGDRETRRIIFDLHLRHPSGKESFITIKTVTPNLDQTQEAKKLMLWLKAHNPVFQPFVGLYYNPTGESQKEYAWSIPNKIFNMRQDSCVLIGRDYWDFLGGPGTYEALLTVFADAGRATQVALKGAHLL